MNELTSEAARTASMLKQIGDKVESLTRFDLSNISAADAETVDVPVACELRYVVSFNRVDHAGYGALPGGTVSMPNKAMPNKVALDSYIQNLRITAEQGLSGRLMRWVADHPVPPEPPLTVNNCFDNKPAVGYVYTCNTCGGSKHVTCGGCGGRGDVTCATCGGRGEYSCRGCGGSGTVSCTSCGGAGYTIAERERPIQRQERISIYSPNDNGYRDEYRWVHTYEKYEEKSTCFSCSGGKEKCRSCGGSGRVSCSCSNGRVRCSSCSGSGKVNCGNCYATGTLYASASLTCEVRSSFVIHATTTFSEAQEKIQVLHSVEALAMLAPVVRTQAKVDGYALKMAYAATVQVTRLQVIAAKQQFEILGYGNSASVENFKDIIGIMLEKDLLELEKSLQKATWISLRPNPDIDAALVNVLASRMHSQIVIEGSQSAEGTKSPAQQEVAHLASDEYVARAFQTIKNSLARLFRGHGLAGVALALGVATVLCIVVHILRLSELARLFAYAGSLLIGLLAGWVYSWYALRQLRTRFAGPLLEKVISLIKVTGSIRTWNKIGIGATLLATVMAVYITGGFWLNGRVMAAKSDLVKVKPTARHYLLTCLQDSKTREKMAAILPTNQIGSGAKDMLQELGSSPGNIKKIAQDGGVQFAMIISCTVGNASTGEYSHEAWVRVFKPLYYEGYASYRTSYLNLLNTDGESGGEGSTEAQRLGELIPPFLENQVALEIANAHRESKQPQPKLKPRPQPQLKPQAQQQKQQPIQKNLQDGQKKITWSTNAKSFRGKNGQRFTYACPAGGRVSGAVWGTDLYTDDSAVCVAAIHAGLIAQGGGGTVSIEIRPGANAYNGSSRNGITSRNYGRWKGSFIFVTGR